MTEPMQFKYQVGGTLSAADTNYVVRDADEILFTLLLARMFCYVFNSRQMGKSSLRTKTMARLSEEGVVCGSVDLTGVGTNAVTMKEWCVSLIRQLHRFPGWNLKRQVKIDGWLKERTDLASIELLRDYLETVVLEQIVEQQVVIFIDEIDAVRSLPFDVSDFFGLIRACFNARAEQPEYGRLTFALFGVATPQDLVQDVRKTPFNIGKAVALGGLEYARSLVLVEGLVDVVPDPQAVLREILSWTGGQPFLTQKLCELVQSNVPEMGALVAGEEGAWVERLVRTQVIENGLTEKDDPVHLRTIRDRVLESEAQAVRLLGLYREVLLAGEVEISEQLDHEELCLSGLVVAAGGKLRVFNRIYAEVFDLVWVEARLRGLRPKRYRDAVKAWLDSGSRDQALLLRGETLQEANAWAKGRRLGDDDYRFLAASNNAELEAKVELIQQANVDLQKTEQKAKVAERKAKQRGLLGVGILGTAFVVAAWIGWKTTQQAQEKQLAIRLGQQSINAQKQFEADQLGALLTAMRAGRELEKVVKDQQKLRTYSTVYPIQALNVILSNIRQTQRMKPQEINTKSGLTGYFPLGLYYDSRGQETIAILTDDGVRLLNKEGKQIAEFPIEISVTDFSFGAKIFLKFTKEKTRIIITKDITRKESQTSKALPQQVLGVSVYEYSNKSEQIPQDGGMISNFKVNLGESSGGFVTLDDGQLYDLYRSVSSNGVLIASFNLSRRKYEVRNILGNLVSEIDGNPGSITFSQDGRLIAARKGNIIQIWNSLGQKITEFSGESYGSILKFSPDGSRLATFSKLGLIVRDISVPGNFQIIMGSNKLGDYHPFSSIKFSWDNKKIAVFQATTGETKIFDIATGKDEISTEISDRGIVMAEFSSDLSGLFSSYQYSSAMNFWNLSKSENKKNKFSPGNDSFTLMQFFGQYPLRQGFGTMRLTVQASLDKNRIVTCNLKGNTTYCMFPTIWDFSQEKVKILPAPPESGNEYFTNTFKPATTSRRLMIDVSSNPQKLLDFTNRQFFALKNAPVLSDVPDPLYSEFAFSDEGNKYIARKDKSIIIKNYKTNESVVLRDSSGKNILSDFELKRLDDNRGYGRFRFSPNGKQVSSPSTSGGLIRRWDMSGNEMSSLSHWDWSRNESRIKDHQYSPDSQNIVTLGEKFAFLWNSSGQKIKQIQEKEEIVQQVSFSTDSQLIFTISDDNIARLWKSSGQLLAKFQLPQADQQSPDRQSRDSIRFSPDGEQIATITNQRTIRLWSWSGELLDEIKIDSEVNIHDVSFSMDGKQLFVAVDYQVPNQTVDGQVSNQTIAGVRAYPIKNLSQLLDQGCEWLHDYLKNGLATNDDRALCNLPPKTPPK